MSKKPASLFTYPYPTDPTNWNEEEKRFSKGIRDLFDILFSRKTSHAFLSDASVGSSNLMDGSVTAAKLDSDVGTTLDISENQTIIDLGNEIDTVNEAAQAAQTSADQGIEDAADALETAQFAQQSANQGIQDAADAKTLAQQAGTAAANAQSTATQAQTAATNAQSSATQAQTLASTAQSTAASAAQNAITAIANAAAAQQKADSADANATTALGQAQAAVTQATSASNTASSAQSTASAANNVAASASSTAHSAQTAAALIDANVKTTLPVGTLLIGVTKPQGIGSWSRWGTISVTSGDPSVGTVSMPLWCRDS